MFMLALGTLLVVVAVQAQNVPAGFEATLLATGLDQPKGVVSAHHRAGAGPFGHDLYVAESGANRITRVDKAGAGATPFTTIAPAGGFPVGVAFYGGPFAQSLYVGAATGGVPGGVLTVDSTGLVVLPFALPGAGIAGLDFGRGPYGHDLYAGQWIPGFIWRVDAAGNATQFVDCLPAPSCPWQTRYLKFSHGNGFGHRLYFTDFGTGDIYKVDPAGNVSLFASTGDVGLEGLDFSSGGAFGRYLYAGSLFSGNIYQVDSSGNVTLWASGFAGAADIHFEPGGRGGLTMYLVTGQINGEAWAIAKKK
jgi:hypothetical protein